MALKRPCFRCGLRPSWEPTILCRQCYDQVTKR